MKIHIETNGNATCQVCIELEPCARLPHERQRQRRPDLGRLVVESPFLNQYLTISYPTSDERGGNVSALFYYDTTFESVAVRFEIHINLANAFTLREIGQRASELLNAEVSALYELEARMKLLKPELPEVPEMYCPKCNNPAKFVRERLFADGSGKVFTCKTAGCKNEGLYFYMTMADAQPTKSK